MRRSSDARADWAKRSLSSCSRLEFSSWGLFVFQSYWLLTTHQGSATGIALAKADLKQKQIALKRKEELYDDLMRRGGSNTELEDARVGAEISSLQLKRLNEPPSLSQAQIGWVIMRCVAAGLSVPIALALLRLAFRQMRRLNASRLVLN